MKPKFRSLIAAFAPLKKSSIIVCASLCAAASAHADRTWSGAADAFWSTPGNWSGNTIPGSSDIAIFNASSVANTATTLAQSFSIQGLTIIDPVAAVSIAAGNTLSLGASGINMSAATQNLTISGPVTLDAAQTWNVQAVPILTATGGVTGTGTLTKSGAGLLSLGGINTYPGVTTVNGGTLAFAGADATPGNGLAISGGATVSVGNTASDFVGSVAFTGTGGLFSSNLSVNSTRIMGIGSIVVDSGTTGTMTHNGRTNLVSGAGATATGSGTLVLNVPASVTANSTDGRYEINGDWSNFTGTLNLVGNNANSTLRLLTNGGSFGGNMSSTTVNLSAPVSGTMSLLGRFSTNGTMRIGGLNGSTASALKTSGGSGAGTFEIGELAQDNLFAGVITNGATTLSLSKVGGGTLTLTGSNDYTGATTVNAGTLKVNGVKSGGGATTVASATLTGTGSFTGGLTTVALDGILAPGDNLVNSGVGNFSHTNLTFALGSILALEFNGTTSNDTITVPAGGNLTINSGTKVFLYAAGTTNTFNIDGTYTIFNIDATNPVTVNSATFVVEDPVPGKIYTFDKNPAGTAITVTIGSNDPRNFWKVDGDGDWGTAANWSKNTVPNSPGALANVGPNVGGVEDTPFSNFSTLTLGTPKTIGELNLNDPNFNVITIAPGASGVLNIDNGSDPGAIVAVAGSHFITAPVAVDAQGVNIDVANERILTVSGVISGPSAVIAKTGPGTLTLTGTNTYGGGTVLSGGLTLIDTAAGLGASTAPATFTGGTLQINATIANDPRPYQIGGAVNGVISTTVGINTYDYGMSGGITPAPGATGGFTKLGAGTITLTGASTYTGTTQVEGGLLVVGSGGSISGGGAMNVSAVGGAQLIVNGGSITSTVTSTISNGSLGFLLSSGSASFATLNMNSNSNNNTVVRVDGGTLTASSFYMRRNASALTGVPTEGFTNIGMYVTDGTVNISGALNLGSDPSASNVGARFDGGTVTVGGVVTIGGNHGARYGVLDVNGATFTSTDVATGVLVGTGATNPDYFLIRNGTATVERIQFGAGTNASTSVVNLSGGALYVGSGGLVVGSTAPEFTPSLQLGSGTLGAKAEWSTLLGATLNGFTEIKAANAVNVGHDITIAGAIGGTGGFVKTGAGTLTLSGTNFYAGITDISEGKLAILGDQSGVGGEVSVASNATLAGNGNIGGNVTIESEGRQEFAVAANPGAQVPRTIVGTLTLNGTTRLDLTKSGPVVSGQYILATASNIVGVPAAGNYNGINAVPAVINGGTTLVINVVANDFDTWISGFSFAPGADLTSTGDPDGDGMNNLQEYAFGLIPNSGASVNPITVPFTKASGSFTYTRRRPSLTGMSYVYQYSTSLGSWTNFTDPNGTTTNNGNPIEAVTVDVPAALLANGSLFVRVQAVK